jgi:hypothetical protein
MSARAAGTEDVTISSRSLLGRDRGLAQPYSLLDGIEEK